MLDIRNVQQVLYRTTTPVFLRNKASRVQQGVKEAVRKFFPEGKMSFPAQMIMVRGLKQQTNG